VGWGDQRFYQTAEITSSLAMRAILWPTKTVLHIAEIPADPYRYFPASEIRELSVPAHGYEKLLSYIKESFELDSGGQIIGLGEGRYGKSHFYAARGSFHAFNTCNTWVSRAIDATGYPLDNKQAITAAEVLSQLKQETGVPCFQAR